MDNVVSTAQRDIQKEASSARRSIIRMIDLMIEDARMRHASDIHIDPAGTHVKVRLRVDGDLDQGYSLPFECHEELIARLKIVAGLRTDEHFSAQDGRFVVDKNTPEETAVRVSILPTHLGENAVLRLLLQDAEESSLQDLGMSHAQTEIVRTACESMNGLVLVSGATGSGKTTTLYTLMRMLSQTACSLVTIEDPVEYTLAGVRQVQILPRTGLTFAQGLRALLRQDPDVIMVGEIRDRETAELSLTAALTGHLVLSTVHARSLESVALRLHDLGVSEPVVASASRLNIYQQLLKKNCAECGISVPLTAFERVRLLERFGEAASAVETHFWSTGCSQCAGLGFRGRVGIFQLSSLNGEGATPHEGTDPILEHLTSGTIRLEDVLRSFHA